MRIDGEGYELEVLVGSEVVATSYAFQASDYYQGGRGMVYLQKGAGGR